MPARKTTTVKTKLQPVKTSAKTTPFTKINPRNLIIPVVIVVAAILLWMGRSELIVATVNGKPISRLEVIKILEAKSGQAAVESLIQKQLIEQEAEKRNIKVADSEVKSDIAKIEKNFSSTGQNLDLVLTQRAMTRDDLYIQIRLQKLVNKMIGRVGVSEKEIDDYIEQNKEAIGQDADMKQVRQQVKRQLLDEKTNAKGQEFVSNLEKNAKINRLKTF